MSSHTAANEHPPPFHADTLADAAPPPPTPPSCTVCNRPAEFACSQCGPGVSYCSQDCQLADWPRHQQSCVGSGHGHSLRAGPAGVHHHRPAAQAATLPEATVARLNDLGFDPDTAADLLFYTRQVYKLMAPIMACIFLSIAWTKISLASTDFRPVASAFTVFNESQAASGGERFAGGLANAGIILAQIAVMTVLLVLLFKYNCMKIIYGLFGLVMVSILGFTGMLLCLAVIQVSRIVVDYITLTFALYNFALVGIVAIFWRAPRTVQQVYLVLMSSLMAFALTGLQEWTTWILLGLLVIWDLFAVLSPYGPLRHLLNTVKEKNQNIEMLVYSVGGIVWFMSSVPGGGPPERRRGSMSKSLLADQPLGVLSSQPAASDDTLSGGSQERLVSATGVQSRSEGVPMARNRVSPSAAEQGTAVADVDRGRDGSANGQEHDAEEEDEEDDDDESGLKLGLGDFVFYSVLAARAAMSDWITTITCIVAVTTGMTMTIFLLAIFRKALPALPISITFGILFYIVSAVTLRELVTAVSISRLVL
ncbi:Presenilin-domain-containing protein [Catenaria anguillulae PL171]|uniref:Presenilin-domain-containing protein n=1 Tax=Catenaria anguillulae PL171 TaxID=765915 RepID=A0A1Y2HW31_9FUNG|nr:Presenilin-domain-containing protein [Catenaria anguillulae PL171]